MSTELALPDPQALAAAQVPALVDDTRVCRTGPYSGHGSGTPYWLIRKGALPRTFDNTFGSVDD